MSRPTRFGRSCRPEVTIVRETPSRLLPHLPAIYRVDGQHGDLARLLRPFEELLFVAPADGPQQLPGIESALARLPLLFRPFEPGDAPQHAPEGFLPWLATWLAFVPHDVIDPGRLRHVIAAVVPLYAQRGTRAYLQRLLELCFGEQIKRLEIDEHEHVGLRVGSSRLGTDSLLAEDRPFWFRVDVDVELTPAPTQSPAAVAGRFERRLRAVIDFAKPAHTAYNLTVRTTRDAAASGSRSQAGTVE
jgi:phage tail-like protein